MRAIFPTFQLLLALAALVALVIGRVAKIDEPAGAAPLVATESAVVQTHR